MPTELPHVGGRVVDGHLTDSILQSPALVPSPFNLGTRQFINLYLPKKQRIVSRYVSSLTHTPIVQISAMLMAKKALFTSDTHFVVYMDFLREKISDETVLERLRVLATNWKKLLRAPTDTLADYGEAQNLLECVPTYIHKVPSFNAADVWMMREFAGHPADDWRARRGPTNVRRS